MIKGIIFDVGGVLIRTHDQSGRRKWEERLGLEPDGAAHLLFASEMGRKAQLGQVSLQDVWAWIGEHLRLSADDLGAFKRDFWAGDRVDEGLVDYIRGLRGRYRTGMLSNTWAKDGRAMAQKFGFADCFDIFVTSAEVGVMKPHPHIFHVALQRLEVSPAEAIFVDDFVENAQAARQLGMQAIHFADPVEAKRHLNELLGE